MRSRDQNGSGDELVGGGASVLPLLAASANYPRTRSFVSHPRVIRGDVLPSYRTPVDTWVSRLIQSLELLGVDLQADINQTTAPGIILARLPTDVAELVSSPQTLAELLEQIRSYDRVDRTLHDMLAGMASDTLLPPSGGLPIDKEGHGPIPQCGTAA